MIELARAQDEEVGDGTTSVIILAGEILTAVEGFLEREIHPTVIVSAYFKALEEIVRITESIGVSRAKIHRVKFASIMLILNAY
jgi:T-complex protein 1 subunit gamma